VIEPEMLQERENGESPGSASANATCDKMEKTPSNGLESDFEGQMIYTKTAKILDER
jgi:hypothetical protein